MKPTFCITSVYVQSYFSTSINEDFFVSLLKGSLTDSPGTLYLVLDFDKKLKQTGPYLIPPLRWLYDFSEHDCFEIQCKCEEVDDPTKYSVDSEQLAVLSAKTSPTQSRFYFNEKDSDHEEEKYEEGTDFLDLSDEQFGLFEEES